MRAVPDATHETVLVNEDNTVVVANGRLRPRSCPARGAGGIGRRSRLARQCRCRHLTGDPQYWLDLVTVDGTPYGAFTLARTVESGVTLTQFLGPVATFADGMAAGPGGRAGRWDADLRRRGAGGPAGAARD